MNYNKINLDVNMNVLNSFSDKESLSQFSPNISILQIKYPEDHQKLMNTFRYILNSKEISIRAFDLTTELIKISPWTYEVWVVRRKCLSEIEEIDIYNEIEFTNMILINFSKVYQVWHHRRLLIDKLNECSQEKKIMQEILDEDNKNFHCWSHRIWMIRRFNNIEDEFDFVDKMLDRDVKNNSAWNYRFFLVEYFYKNNIDNDIIREEIEYALEKIKIVPFNESPFNYINGFIRKYKKKYKDFNNVIDELILIYEKEKDNNCNNCVFILRILLEYYEEIKNKNKFNDIIDQLIVIDYIRKQYYLWRKKNYNDSE
jgi:protein farnesyltransferase/geranylgeranyltransferase type-1 subunit alpha